MLPVLAVFGVISLPLALLAIPLAFLGGLMFAGIAMCFTAITPGIDTLNYPAFLFITPMTLFSGTFFPLAILPVALQYFALALLPLTHLVAVMRMFTQAAVSPVCAAAPCMDRHGHGYLLHCCNQPDAETPDFIMDEVFPMH